MTNYNKLSDFEINKMVGMLSIKYKEASLSQYRNCDFFEYCDDAWRWHEFDPCNNPSDAWPIIVENRIGLSPSGDIWHAYAPQEDFVCSVENPLRAAMIVFLMMKEGEK